MHQAAQLRIDVIVAALRSLPTEERRSIVDASASLRELSSRVPPIARDVASWRT